MIVRVDELEQRYTSLIERISPFEDHFGPFRSLRGVRFAVSVKGILVWERDDVDFVWPFGPFHSAQNLIDTSPKASIRAAACCQRFRNPRGPSYPNRDDQSQTTPGTCR